MSPKSFDLDTDAPATPPASTLTGRRVRIVAVSAAALALATGGVAFAASGHDDGPNPGNGGARPTGTPPSGAPSGEAHGGPGGPGHGGPGAGGPGFAGVGGPDVLHAVVVRSVKGGTETDDVQSGKVTAISATSVTVKSSDGFTATYVVNSSTKFHSGRDSTTAPAVGAAVTVSAKVSGSTATATTVDTRPAAPKAPASASASPSAS
jgi:hypothetical protein